MNWRAVVRVLLLGPAGFYVLMIVGLFVFQRSFLFPCVGPEPFLDLTGATRTEVTVEGGTVPMDRSGAAGAPVVVFFHGNAEQIGLTRGDAEQAGAVGLGFVAVEYPGYGDAHAGTPSETSILGAARAALDKLAKTEAQRPTCMGHSIGSGVAVAMAAEGRCAKLVVVSAYTSIADLAADQFPYVPARWLVLDRFDSLGRAPSISVPTLVIHGRRDDLIPFAMGQSLAAAIPGARFVERDRGHNDIRDDETWAAVAHFVAVL